MPLRKLTSSLHGYTAQVRMTACHIHLHLHSEFSLIDSTIRITGLIGAAVRAGMPALALTDECNMFAFVKFYKACMASNRLVAAICGFRRLTTRGRVA